MQINLDNLVSISEANQNFSKVARLVDKQGAAVILKNNSPCYVLIDYAQLQENAIASDDTATSAANKILAKHIRAFEELAK